MASPSTRYLPTLLASADQHLQQLYQLLIQPLQPLLAHTQAIVIVPDQTLHYIPFHALYDGAHYLLEHYRKLHAKHDYLDLCLTTTAQGQGVLLGGYDNHKLAAVATE